MLPRHAAQMPARRRWADECALLDRQPLHAGFVAENAAARNRARGIDAQHRDVFAAVANQVHAERIDESALADAGHARDPHTPRLARMGQHFVEQASREVAIGRKIAFNYRDGARQDHPVSGQDPVDVSLQRQAFPCRERIRLF